jgi:hypothetical protein
VRTDEPACPFCAAALPAGLEALAAPPAPGRISRTAVFVFGATLSVAACSGSISVGQQGDTGGGFDAGPEGGCSPDDGGAWMTHYGSPPPPEDAGPTDDGGTMQDGAVVAPLYAPPPPPTPDCQG